MSKNNSNSFQMAIGASYSVLGSLALFGFGGYWLDRYRESGNYWLIIGLLLSVVIGMYELAKFILKK